jgi:hypothetical protein
VTLEANGPGAHLTRRGWQTLRALLLLAPDFGTAVEVSHLELADRIICSRRTVARGLVELVALGIVTYIPGHRVGARSLETRVSTVKLWREMLPDLLTAGRELVRVHTARAATATRARMRAILDNRSRARDRRRSVENVSSLFDPDRSEERFPRSPVVDSLSTSPPGTSPDSGGWCDSARLVFAQYGSQARKKAQADAAARRGPDKRS